MRDAAVLVHRDDRLVAGGRETLSQECLHDPLLDVVFRCTAVTYAFAYFPKCLGCYEINPVACPKVCANLFIGQCRLELCDEIPGADDLMAEASDHLYRSSIHHADVEDQIIGRVLHSDAPERHEDGFELIRQLVPR